MTIPGTILDTARTQVLEQGIGLNQQQLMEVLTLPEEQIPDLMELAHQVRLKWCGEEIEVEGIISLKTGGCLKIVISAHSLGCLNRRCVRCGWIFRIWLKPLNRPQKLALPNSVSSPQSRGLMRGS